MNSETINQKIRKRIVEEIDAWLLYILRAIEFFAFVSISRRKWQEADWYFLFRFDFSQKNQSKSWFSGKILYGNQTRKRHFQWETWDFFRENDFAISSQNRFWVSWYIDFSICLKSYCIYRTFQHDYYYNFWTTLISLKLFQIRLRIETTDFLYFENHMLHVLFNDALFRRIR